MIINQVVKYHGELQKEYIPEDGNCMFNTAIAGILKEDKQLKERLTELGIKQITGAEEESKQDMNNNITVFIKV